MYQPGNFCHSIFRGGTDAGAHYLFSFYNIKLHRLAISNTAEEFTGVVPLDCGLVKSRQDREMRTVCYTLRSYQTLECSSAAAGVMLTRLIIGFFRRDHIARGCSEKTSKKGSSRSPPAGVPLTPCSAVSVQRKWHVCRKLSQLTGPLHFSPIPLPHGIRETGGPAVETEWCC